MALRLKIVSRHQDSLADRRIKEFGQAGGTIGRSVDSDWVLPDGQRYVSSRHASIDFRSGSFYIVDTSTNGVYVNGADTPVGRGKPQRLFDGDRIRIGEYEITAEIDEETTVGHLIDEHHVDPVDRAQRVEAPDPTGEDMVTAFEITGVGMEMKLTDEEIETLTPPSQRDRKILELMDDDSEGMARTKPFLERSARKVADRLAASNGAPIASVARPARGARSPLPDEATRSAVSATALLRIDMPDAGLSLVTGANELPLALKPEPALPVPAASRALPVPAASQALPVAAASQTIAVAPAAPAPQLLAGSSVPRATPPKVISKSTASATPVTSAAPAAPAAPAAAAAAAVPAVKMTAATEAAISAAMQAAKPPAARAAARQPTSFDGVSGGDPTRALEPFFRGAGIKSRPLDPQRADALLLCLGQVMREMVVGMSEILHQRAEQKNAMRLPNTTIQPQNNNPLKFSAGVEEALLNLLLRDSEQYLVPVEAVREAFLDIKLHQQVLLKALRAAVDGFIERLDPDELEQKFSTGKSGMLINAANKLKYWDLYKDLFQVVAHHPPGELPMQFLDDFAHAYEQETADSPAGAARTAAARAGSV